MRLGVISDTHNVLKEEVLRHLQGCDYIIHAGDICRQEIVEQLNQITKTFVVKGNNDKDEWGSQLPDYLEIELGDHLIYVVHDKKDIPKNLNDVDLVIYGHSHKYDLEYRDELIFLNPGGCGKKRFSLPLTMALVELTEAQIKIDKIELELAK